MIYVLPVYSTPLTHWGRVTHISVAKPTIIGSDNGLSPRRRQAIIWTNDGILLIGPSGTNFTEILIAIQTFSWNKIHLKMSSVKSASISSWPQCFTHLHLVPSKCIIALSHHWFKKQLGTCSVPSHYLNQWCLLIYRTPRNSEWVSD